MKTGDVIEKDIIVMAKTDRGFSSPLVFECGTVLPSYGLSNGGIAVWEEFHQRAGLIENAQKNGTCHISITAFSSGVCPKDGNWEILGTEVKVSLVQGDTFPPQYQDYIWTLR